MAPIATVQVTDPVTGSVSTRTMHQFVKLDEPRGRYISEDVNGKAVNKPKPAKKVPAKKVAAKKAAEARLTAQTPIINTTTTEE